MDADASIHPEIKVDTLYQLYFPIGMELENLFLCLESPQSSVRIELKPFLVC